jgi:hypothetical protein
MVAAYAQYLSITLLKPAVVAPEGSGLIGSTTGEVQHMKGQHHVLVAAVLAQGNISLAHRGKLEVRGYIANFCGHKFSFRVL